MGCLPREVFHISRFEPKKLILHFRLHFHQQYRRSGQVVRGCAPSSHDDLIVAKKMPNGQMKILAVRNFIIRECSCVNIFVCWVFTRKISPCTKLLCKQKNFAVNFCMLCHAYAKLCQIFVISVFLNLLFFE